MKWCKVGMAVRGLAGLGELLVGSGVGLRFVGVCALWRDRMDVRNRVYYFLFVMMFGCLFLNDADSGRSVLMEISLRLELRFVVVWRVLCSLFVCICVRQYGMRTTEQQTCCDVLIPWSRWAAF